MYTNIIIIIYRVTYVYICCYLLSTTMNKFQKLINHPSEIELYMTVCADVLCMMTVYVFSGFFNSSKNILN